MGNGSHSATAVLVMLLLLAASPAIGQVIWPDRTYELSPEDRNRLDALRRSQNEADAKEIADMKAVREKLLRSPPLPDERNMLLGRWRVEGATRPKNENEQFMALFTKPGAACEMLFGSDVTEFASTTFSSSGLAGLARGPIAYRSAGKVIAAIPANSTKVWAFEVANPNRMVAGDNCALVRVGAPAANAAANAANAPSNARAGAAGSSAPPAAGQMPQVAAVSPSPQPTPSPPPREVCVNTLVDKLGAVGVAQVRAMAKVRYTEPAIEGKVPNTNNLRIDLRGSACDDPRVKASLYDFDANGMLQSITYVWDRPVGPLPAPIFSERIAQLSRFHSLPPPQSPGRLQADTSLGRLVLQEVPERNLLLEAYTTIK